MTDQRVNNQQEIGDRLAIVQAAIQLYLDDDSAFTIHNLSTQLEVEPSDIYSYYPNKNAILDGYYSLLVDRYRMMIDDIDEFDSYDLAEKTSNFIYASFDIMGENREFVEETFERRVFDASSPHPFQQKVKSLLKQFLAEDSKIASTSQLLMQDLFYDFLVRQYFHLIRFWLSDGSANSEKSMAYADKMTSFLQEMLYTSVLDRGLDLAKFMAVNDPRWQRIPVIGTLSRKILQ